MFTGLITAVGVVEAVTEQDGGRDLTIRAPWNDVQVGESIANAVRDNALPATVVTAALLVPLTYVGCAGAAWLGAVVYTAIIRSNAGKEQKR